MNGLEAVHDLMKSQIYSRAELCNALYAKKKDLKIDSKFYRDPMQRGKDREDMIPFLSSVKNL